MYIISEITPRKGELRDIHQRMLGSECEIIDCRLDNSAVLRYRPSETETKTAVTSRVTGIGFGDDGSVLITTKNTEYVLKEV